MLDLWTDLLLRQPSPVVTHGRCFGRVDVLTEEGLLVASYAEEGLLRFHGERDMVRPRRESVRISHRMTASEKLILAVKE